LDSQNQWVVPPTRIGRFENLQNSVRRLLMIDTLPHVNTSTHKEWTHYYRDPEIIDLVAKLFFRDVKMLGYEGWISYLVNMCKTSIDRSLAIVAKKENVLPLQEAQPKNKPKFKHKISQQKAANKYMNKYMSKRSRQKTHSLQPRVSVSRFCKKHR
jgi:hypothetical protein